MMLRVFNQSMAALQSGAGAFSRDFIQWLRALVDAINGAAVRNVEVDLGSTPLTSGTFTITDSAINSSQTIIIVQAPGPYTRKGTRADEAEMDALTVTATAGTGVATANWSSPTPVRGNFKFNYVVT